MSNFNKTSLHERFFEKVKQLDNGCWLWAGSLNRPNGYGQICFEGKTRKATHASIFLKTGDWPETSRKVYVCHTCDTPSCVNPDHLFVGTAKENADDMYKKGRGYNSKPGAVFLRYTPIENAARGEGHGCAKLKEMQVIEILRLFSFGARRNDLARMFCVNPATIQRIVNGKLWKHVPRQALAAIDSLQKGE